MEKKLLLDNDTTQYVEQAEDFLSNHSDSGLDGSHAAAEISAEISQTNVLERNPIGNGFYQVIGKRNAGSFGEIVPELTGKIVLVPANVAGVKANSFFPAVVSPDTVKSNASVRLHIFKQSYDAQSGLSETARVMLGGAGQSELRSVGKRHDAAEAEHLSTLMAISGNDEAVNAFKGGYHVNHGLRRKPNRSVISGLTSTTLGDEFHDVVTATIPRKAISANKTAILWHDKLKDKSGRPEDASRENALVIVQALGFSAIQDRAPKRLDNLKRALA